MQAVWSSGYAGLQLENTDWERNVQPFSWLVGVMSTRQRPLSAQEWTPIQERGQMRAVAVVNSTRQRMRVLRQVHAGGVSGAKAAA